MKVRFAPSPTGYIHVGNARAALANWLVARKAGGRFVLRLDDTDTARSKPEYARAIEEDLRWLGLDWDQSFRQSDRTANYAAAAEKLKAQGRLYPCLESEEELEFKREQRRRQNKPPVYDRAALKMTAEQLAKAEANGKQPYWRFKLSNGEVSWKDGVLGDRRVKLPAISDPVLVRADGTFLYTFTSVVDDIETGVTDIIRGEDHVTNTGIQLDIMAALGLRREMRFAHLPLLVDAEGSPLSKRLNSVSLRQFRRDGIEPAALAGYLATLGTSTDPVPAMPADLVQVWDMGRVSRSAARFDPRQMMALNRKYLHGLDFAAVRERLPSGATERFWLAVRGNLDTLAEAQDWLDIAEGDVVPPVQAEEAAFLRDAIATLPEEPWGDDTWSRWTAALAERTGRKGRVLFWPLRRALTGEEHGPDLKALLPLIGRERALTRLTASAG
ncbi:glutamate--tRNA ligase [Roseomonas elaeocarpi]|uniref:Glutamate--tRNA ligase n=1 Tax=Roseomonas elaeocarpi TaxID=907779 RepID=A0ABV6JPY4_9PROT